MSAKRIGLIFIHRHGRGTQVLDEIAIPALMRLPHGA
jgi:hypothetical protein